MESITDYLIGIFVEFREHVKELKKLCELKTVNYDSAKLPNYNDKYVQEFYLLRYAFAYAFEYKQMYEKILPKDNTLPETIRILSIGCGNGIDYWSAAQAIENNHNQVKASIDYLGIDRCSWEYSPKEREGDRFVIEHQDVGEFFCEHKRIEPDVVIFPKSLSEFDDNTIHKLCSEFREIEIPCKDLTLLFSLREKEKNKSDDLNKAKLIIDAFENNINTKLCGDNSELENKVFTNENVGIVSLDKTFKYPDETYDYMGKLSERCLCFQLLGEQCCNDCSDKLNRHPILRANHLRYLIVPLKAVK